MIHAAGKELNMSDKVFYILICIVTLFFAFLITRLSDLICGEPDYFGWAVYGFILLAYVYCMVRGVIL